MKPPFRAAAAVAFAFITALSAVAPAAADETIAEVDRPTAISAHDGRLLWSEYDAATRTYRLMTRVAGVTSAVPVAPRPVAFDADLGPDEQGRSVAVYSRCVREDADRRERRGCDVHRYDFASGAETKVPSASTRRWSEFLPSIWRGRVAFARADDRRPVAMPRLYVRKLLGGRAQRIPGGPVGREVGRGPVGLDLYGRRLAVTWQYFGNTEGTSWQLRLSDRNGHTRVVRTTRSGALSAVMLTGPAFEAGRLYAGVNRWLAAGDRFLRYSLRAGRLQEVPSRRDIIALTFDEGRFVYVQGAVEAGAACQQEVVPPEPPVGTCAVRIADPVAF